MKSTVDGPSNPQSSMVWYFNHCGNRETIVYLYFVFFYNNRGGGEEEEEEEEVIIVVAGRLLCTCFHFPTHYPHEKWKLYFVFFYNNKRRIITK